MGIRNSIMIVDDDSLFIEMLSNRLEGVGYIVTTAPDANAAFTQAKALRPRLIISDMQMPAWGTGTDLYHNLRQEPTLRDIPIIFVSGMEPSKLIQTIAPFKNDPKIRILAKPLNWVMLEQAIADLIGEQKFLGTSDPR